MKIDSIKEKYFSQGCNIEPQKHRLEYGARVCECKQENSVSFGSGASNCEAAFKVFNNLGKTLGDKIAGSNRFNKLLVMFEDKPVIASALVGLGVAGVLRPITNMAMSSSEDFLDSLHAAAHALSTAIIGFVFSVILMRPFDKAFKKFKENPKAYLEAVENKKDNNKTIQALEKFFNVHHIGQRQLAKSKMYNDVTKVAQMIPDVVTGIPKAMITIACIPFILKGLEKIFPKKQVENPQQMNFVQVSMKGFCGGDK